MRVPFEAFSTGRPVLHIQVSWAEEVKAKGLNWWEGRVNMSLPQPVPNSTKTDPIHNAPPLQTCTCWMGSDQDDQGRLSLLARLPDGREGIGKWGLAKRDI